MKTISLKSAVFAAPLAISGVIALANCSTNDPTATNSAAGAPGASGATMTGTSGAAMTGTSGAAMTGTSGSATTGMSGSAGTGGAGTAGAGGAGTTGGVGGAGTTGGAGGMTAAGCDTAAACLTNPVVGGKSDFGIPLSSSWWITGCAQPAGHDCITIANCPNTNDPVFEKQGAVVLETFPVGGTKDQNYKITFNFNGVSEAKEYEKGTRDQGANVPNNVEAAVSDTFYRDGNSIPSHYNVMRLSVLDSTGAEKRHYYMNSFPAGGGYESHRTFLLSYTKSIVVVGGGKITYLIEDSNCHAIDNCGAGQVSDTECLAARSIPTEPNVMLPPMYKDPADQMLKATALLAKQANGSLAQPWHSQASHLTITKVEQTNDPVTMDYK